MDQPSPQTFSPQEHSIMKFFQASATEWTE
jgi:hypothetical protein